MCGITGFVSPGDRKSSVDPKKIASAMAHILHHRGPDADGVWIDHSGIALAHTRLSILDLSPSGEQPMASKSGRYVLVFNGEIYNHLDLRQKLAKDVWQGHSDTETFLAACEAWGVQEALTHAVGMFAIALWDKRERVLTLARDRFGEKPLFYGWQGGSFVFGSELKSLMKHPEWQGKIDRDSLEQFTRYGYIPLPRSIWRGVKKLLPGSFLRFSIDTSVGELPTPTYYWRARDIANNTLPLRLNEKEASDELDLRLRQTISSQMVADVPLGAFLSGGVDSSTVVAMMQALSSRPVSTYTIGFSEADYNEAEYAKAVASYLGTEHTELYVSSSDALDVIPLLPQMYDEPFGDVSQIPTHLVAALARKHVKVSLSGDGGDEIFGGYNRHILGPSLWEGLSKFPIGIRKVVARSITAFSPTQWSRVSRLLPRRFRQPMFGDRAHKLASIMTAQSADEVYQWLVSHERKPESLVIGSREDGETPATWAQCEMALMRRDDFSERMMFGDQVGYLTDDILCKVDRAAMAASLETRVPFLDHRIAEFAWALPSNMKIRDGQGKWLLRQVLYRYVPKNLIERAKQGFGVPIDFWLRGPLRNWAEDLIDESRLKQEGYFDSEQVRQKWKEHLSGRRNWQYWLWNILMFQAWHENWNK
jgi:asparagine synthase (glutamine-hydrolysing)